MVSRGRVGSAIKGTVTQGQAAKAWSASDLHSKLSKPEKSEKWLTVRVASEMLVDVNIYSPASYILSRLAGM